MLKIPVWILKKLIQAGKLDPNDLLTQSSVDEIAHLIKDLIL